ncbi:NADPH:quinone oxidoreductase family protein [Reichenbachiella carrageenanivorans]|uniref:NADPH:quinone oxidoreductase family protein n=1 Tax=Reichenbachiella carrageenanivorans TaxID=2979869 RepID=A0ABY6CYG1_9BACT|nr:NADPH:quinone oxidoreductase family protein [Reichenbachiella carrageenanivorans]UXX78951.1 NADPH:quinone oxidoreductase family protein [Reichenbachiella carrageenanivorans]
MKAVLCESYGPPENLVVKETESLVPDIGEVIISVKASGLNFPDTLIIEGKYQFQPEMPFSPGGEVAGVIKSVGEGVPHLQVGDRVMAGTGWGGFAEEVRGKATNVFPLPDSIDFVQAAATMMTFGTSYHALVNRAQLQTGETLLVLGAAGGVGTAAIQIGKALGATVIAAASTDEKLAYCQSIGADLTINYSKEDLKEQAKALTNGKGVDVIYDPVGDRFAEPALRAIAWKGRYLVVGFAAGEIPKIPMNLPLLKGCSIVGVFWGGFFRNEPQENADNFKTIVQWLEEGKVHAQVYQQYPLEKVAEAMHELKLKKVKGKIVFVP